MKEISYFFAKRLYALRIVNDHNVSNLYQNYTGSYYTQNTLLRIKAYFFIQINDSSYQNAKMRTLIIKLK